MPLYIPTPHVWSLYDGDLGGGAASTLAANQTYIVGVVLFTTEVATGMMMRAGGTAAGHIDMGIYDENGNLINHTGSVTYSANAANIVNFTGNSTSTLSPGRYWLALWIDNNTDTPVRYNTTAAGTAVSKQSHNTSATGLLSTFSAFGGMDETSGQKPIIRAILQGGFA